MGIFIAKNITGEQLGVRTHPHIYPFLTPSTKLPHILETPSLSLLPSQPWLPQPYSRLYPRVSTISLPRCSRDQPSRARIKRSNTFLITTGLQAPLESRS